MQNRYIRRNDPEEPNLEGLDPFVNSREADDVVLRKLPQDGNYKASTLTVYDGKIFLGNPLDYDDPSVVINRKNWLVNIPAWHKRKALAAAGKMDEAEGIEWASEAFKALLEEKKRQAGMAALVYEPVRYVLGAAGPQLNTAYEIVRRTNWLTEVKGPSYNLAVYNAINIVNQRNTPDLNATGFRRAALLTGQKEIGDNVIPELAQNTFTSYDKFLYADSFRYEFGMREKRQSVPNIEEQVTRDIPGVFAKLKDDKITTLAKAVSATTPTTDWDALTGEHYTNQADKDVEDLDNGLVSFGGAAWIIWPRAVANAYLRNVNGAPAPLNKESIATPVSAEQKRAWNLPLNQHITGYINASIAAGELIGGSPMWATLMQGPEIQVTYKNQLTPAQMEGRIIFNFNGVVEDTPAAAARLQGLLA